MGRCLGSKKAKKSSKEAEELGMGGTTDESLLCHPPTVHYYMAVYLFYPPLGTLHENWDEFYKTMDSSFVQYVNLDTDVKNPAEPADQAHPEYGRALIFKAHVYDGQGNPALGKTVKWEAQRLLDSTFAQSGAGFDAPGSGVWEKTTTPDDEGMTPPVKFFLSTYGGERFFLSASCDEVEPPTKQELGQWVVWRKFWCQVFVMADQEAYWNLPDECVHKMGESYGKVYIELEEYSVDPNARQAINHRVNITKHLEVLSEIGGFVPDGLKPFIFAAVVVDGYDLKPWAVTRYSEEIQEWATTGNNQVFSDFIHPERLDGLEQEVRKNLYYLPKGTVFDELSNDDDIKNQSWLKFLKPDELTINILRKDQDPWYSPAIIVNCSKSSEIAFYEAFTSESLVEYKLKLDLKSALQKITYGGVSAQQMYLCILSYGNIRGTKFEQEYLEAFQTTAVHEIGHTLGLLNQGPFPIHNWASSQDNGHCAVKDCVMNAKAETGDGASLFDFHSDADPPNNSCAGALRRQDFSRVIMAQMWQW